MSQELTHVANRTELATPERSLDQTFSEVDLEAGVEASAGIAMLQVATFARGQQKALNVIDRIADEGMQSVDRKVDSMLLRRYEGELRGLLATAEDLLAKDPKDVLLADFVTVKRDLRRARQNVAAQLQIVDSSMSTSDIDEFFADVDEIINMRRPGALRATHVNIGGRWIKPGDDRPENKRRRSRRKSQSVATV